MIRRSHHTHFPSVSISTDNNGFTKTVHLTATDDEGNTYKMKRKDGVIVEFFINGKAVPGEEYHKYGYIFDTLVGEMNDQKPPVPPTPPVPAVAPAPSTAPTPAVSARPMTAPTPATEAEGVTPPVAPIPATEMSTPPEAVEPVHPAHAMPREPRAPRAPIAPQAPKVADTIGDMIISDLRKAGLVSDLHNLSFQLDANGLLVNGEKAPAGIEQTLREKYVKDPRDHYILSRTSWPGGSSTHSDIEQKKSKDQYPRWN